MVQLLNLITAKLQKSQIEIDDNWVEKLSGNQGFEYICKQAGLENDNGFRIYGYLTSFLDEDKLKKTVLTLLKEDMNNYYPNWVVLYLVGFLDYQEAIPILVDGIKTERYESHSFLKYAFNSLVMLGAESSELIALLEEAVAEYDSDELKYLLIHQYVASNDPIRYGDVLEIYRTIEPFSRSKGRGFKFMIEIAKSGLDTSQELYSAITHGVEWDDFQATNIAQWYRYAQSELVNKRIFHEIDLRTNGIEILYAVLEDPTGWEFLKVILPDLIEEWNEKLSYGEEQIKGEYISVAVAALGALGEDVSEHLDGWYGEAGVYLSEIYNGESRDYLSEYKSTEGKEYFEEWTDAADDEHDFLDYQVLQKQCSLLFAYICKNDSKFHEYILLTKLTKMREDVLFKRTLSSILIFLKNKQILSGYWLKARLSTTCSAETMKELVIMNPKACLEFIHENRNSWGKVIPGDYLSHTTANINSFLLALIWDNSNLEEYLKEAFITERDSDVALGLLMVIRYKNIQLTSPVALAKEKLHIGYGDNHQLSRKEFDEIIPLIFSDKTSWYYRHHLLMNSKSIFSEEPELALRILRYSPESKNTIDWIFEEIQYVEDEPISDFLVSAQDDIYDTGIETVNLLYGEVYESKFALTNAVLNGEITGIDAIKALDEGLEHSLGYYDVTDEILAIAPKLLTPEEQVPFFDRWCDEYGISDLRKSIIDFIIENPNKVYLPICQKLAGKNYHMSEEDISAAFKAVIDAGAVIPEKKLTISIGEEGDYLTVISKDGQFVLDTGRGEIDFDEADDLVLEAVDGFFDEENLSKIKPDKIRIELYEDDERIDLFTFPIFHDDLADFCSSHSDEEIEEEIERLYEEAYHWGVRLLNKVLPKLLF